MSPERPLLTPSERLLLASRVNHFCSLKIGDNFDLGEFLEDAQKIVDSFDSTLELSGDWYFQASFRGKSSSFGGLMSTGNGQFQSNLESGRRERNVKFGRIYEDRIGLYKVIKSDQGDNFALSFNYFMEQVSRDKRVVGIGPLTHILYDKKDRLIKAVIKSEPMLLKFLKYKTIWFKQSTLWGKGKLTSFKIEVFW